ncbi:MAG: gamma-glutamyl-gamma-aminobutyrate hydrolase family protein [Gammaproteobacteria bacterium]
MGRQGQRVFERPVIAVTGPDSRYPLGWWATRLAINSAGGIPVRLTPATYLRHEKESFQGIIIGGGNDIDPELYGGDDDGISRIDPARDAFEVEMIEHALNKRLPTLGICRGAQLINVVLGGSLFGDIRGLRHLTSNRRTPLPRKTALIDEESKLFKILSCRQCRINSLHHQAIDRLGDGLSVAAWDLDDFVQAIESTEYPFVIGTQWHPEYIFYFNSQRNLFKQLVKEAQSSRPKKLNA